ncbi:GGDEF domain-containing protein [bacterium]|jgi:two-component system cell cycle response regulator|nr:MAG: GGDEF domain-containing protein [bacterium]
MAQAEDIKVYKERIAALQAQVRELHQRLVTDELTQIFNRRGLMEYLEAIASEVMYQYKHPDKRRSVIIKSLTIIFLDIDHFKKVNDTYGHDAGDEVLRQTADLIRERVRQLDIVGRYGGEEIVVGLPGASIEHAQRIADDLRSIIESHEFQAGDSTLSVTASLGVAELTPARNIHQTLKAADNALYKAKETGRNKVVVG